MPLNYRAEVYVDKELWIVIEHNDELQFYKHLNNIRKNVKHAKQKARRVECVVRTLYTKG